MKKIVFLTIALFVFGTIYSQTISVNTSTYTNQQLVEDILIDSPCALVSNITSSASCGIGYFSYAGTNFNFPSGVILRNGNASHTAGSYTGNNLSSTCSSATDADLQAISNANGLSDTIQDATYLQFDFTPLTDNFSFDFIFASNEYGIYQCGYSDVFAFILTDLATGTQTNLAVIPGTTTPISVTNIRDGQYNTNCASANANYFSTYNVGAATSLMNMRGYTVPFTAQATVVPNTNYRIKLAIGDYKDSNFDSAVFLAAGSFNVGTAELTYPWGVGTLTDDITSANGLGLCSNQTIELDTGLNDADYDFEWTFNGNVISTATSSTLVVDAAGTYCVSATLTGTSGSSCVQTDCIEVEYFSGFTINDSPGTYQECNPTSPPYTFNFNNHTAEILGPTIPAADYSNYDITYYASAADAQNGFPQLSSTYTSNTSPLTVYVKVENFLYECPEFTQFTAEAIVCGLDDLELCDIGNDGVETFDLTQQTSVILGSNDPANYTVNYHTSQAGATSGTTDLATPANAYPNTSNPQTIYVSFTNNATGVVDDSVNFQLILLEVPEVTSLTSNTPICEGDDAVFTITGTADATVDYEVNGTAGQVLLDSSGIGTVTITAVTTDQTIVLNLITLGDCNNPLTNTTTVIVYSNPNIGTVTNNGPICEGDDAVFTITGTPNATVTYTVNGGTNQTVTLDTSGNGTITETGATADVTLTLVDITSTEGCSTNLTITSTVVVKPNPEVTNLTATTPICEGDDAVFTLTGTADATVDYDVNGTAGQVLLDSSGAGTVTITGVTADQTITLSETALNGCTTTLTDTATVTVNSNPTFTSITNNSPICEDPANDAVFTLTGTPNATVTYTVNGGTNQTVALDASGNGTITVTAPTTDVTVALVTITSTENCETTLTTTSTVIVNTTPEVTNLISNTPICEGYDAVFTITGTPNATVDYDVNGTTGQVLMDTSGNGIVTITGVTTDQTITLNQITLNTCNATLTNTTTVTVNPSPTFTSVTDNGPVCEGDTVIFTLTGTPDATITYTVDGGTSQTVALDTTGSGTVTVNTTTTDVTIALQDIEKDNCTIPINTNATATVNSLPSITAVTGNGTICEGTDAIFTINGTANSEVSYTINSGTAQTTTLNASGEAMVTIPTVTQNQTITLISIVDVTQTTMCTTNVTDTATVTIVDLPTVTFTASNTTVCMNRTSTLNFVGTPNATVNFTDGTTNYSVTLDASGNGSFITPGLVTATTYTLVDAITAGTPTCSQNVTGSVTINVSPEPNVVNTTYTANICSGSTTDIVVALNNTTTYTWNATISNIDGGSYQVSGNETNINQTATLVNQFQQGFIDIEITPYLASTNCLGESHYVSITVNPIPVIANITEQDLTLCSGENAVLTITSNPSNTQYNWTAITNGVTTENGVISGTTTSEINLEVEVTNPLTAGTIQFEITPVNNGCIGTTMTSAIFTVNPVPGETIPSPDKTICSGEQAGLIISAGSPVIPNATIEWEVYQVENVSGAQSGTSTTSPITITDVLEATTATQGYVIYRVKTSLGECQQGHTDYTVYVNPLPEATLTDGAICVENGTNNVYQSYILNAGIFTGNYTFTWYETSDTTNAIAVTSVPTLEVDAVGSYYVEIENTDTGCSATSTTASVTAVNPVESITTTVTNAFDAATVVVNSTGGTGTIQYQLDDGAFQHENTFTQVPPGEHTVTVIDTQGCTYLVETVTVIDYPKFFTPNGDNYNDTWNIIGFTGDANAKIYIFDRYGKLLKEITSQDTYGWDGRLNGQPLPASDYWFTVEYIENNVQKTFKSHFSLKR